MCCAGHDAFPHLSERFSQVRAIGPPSPGARRRCTSPVSCTGDDTHPAVSAQPRPRCPPTPQSRRAGGVARPGSVDTAMRSNVPLSLRIAAGRQIFRTEAAAPEVLPSSFQKVNLMRTDLFSTFWLNGRTAGRRVTDCANRVGQEKSGWTLFEHDRSHSCIRK